MEKTCPKCSYTRKPTDYAPDYECPSCGVIYSKFVPATATSSGENEMESNGNREVIVTDVKMPFGSMVVFMVKWSLAAIPAIIILAIVWAIAVGVLGGLFAALGRR